MVGANSIIRVVGATCALLFILFAGAIGVTLIDPIYANVVDQSLMSTLGWGSPQGVVFLFFALAMIALVFVIVIWLVVAPIKRDVRQDTGPPF